jgi:co-chaperonin GroES (HSP10)
MRIDVESIASAKDPRKAIFDILGEQLKVIVEDLYGNRVLLATYVRPDKTAGGIYRPKESIEEDRYVGKAGLILALGDQAFENDAIYKWKRKPKIGEWVFFYASDAREIGIAGLSCRIISDYKIAGRSGNPLLLY